MPSYYASPSREPVTDWRFPDSNYLGINRPDLIVSDKNWDIVVFQAYSIRSLRPRPMLRKDVVVAGNEEMSYADEDEGVDDAMLLRDTLIENQIGGVDCVVEGW